MADEVKILDPIPALYDFVLYWECASKDWKSGAKKSTISGNGSLMEMINWNSTYSFDPDDAGGKTLFGVTEASWQAYVKKYPEKGYSSDLNSMGQKGWMDQINWYWSEKSSSGLCANYACAFVMFQMVWVGFSKSSQENLLETLKKNADKKDYNFITSGSNYRRIADATHAYTDPMIAYDYMRKANSSYYYNISTPNRTNKKYRMGWLNRASLSYTPYGLYVPVSVSGSSAGLKYESSLSDWEAAAKRMAENNTSGYVKIMDWGASPESIAQMAASTYDFFSSASAGFSPNMCSSGVYGGCGCVSQLGNYSSAPDMQIEFQQTQNREDVLNTLLMGSYTPNDVKKCEELISSDKKKHKKIKSKS